MGAVILVVIALAAVGAAAVGVRHSFLKVSRPHGFECSLRVRTGELDGLTHRFRAGYAGREVDGFVWRRIAWPSPRVRFPATAVRLDDRAPSVRDHILSVPASFALMTIELDDGTRIDLALARRRRDRIIAALGS